MNLNPHLHLHSQVERIEQAAALRGREPRGPGVGGVMEGDLEGEGEGEGDGEVQERVNVTVPVDNRVFHDFGRR